jgi:hypothetical protein
MPLISQGESPMAAQLTCYSLAGSTPRKAEGSGLHRGRGGNQREARSRPWKLWTGLPSGVSLPACN